MNEQLRLHAGPEGAASLLREIAAKGADYGRCNLGGGQSLQVEFVSADPTAPISLSHGRGAALGDALANLLAFAGFHVSREYYVNDASSQVERLGASVEARFLELLGRDATVPADGFHEPYVREVAERLRARYGDALADLPAAERRERFTRLGCQEMLREQQETLERFGVRFDLWYRESELHRQGKVDEVIRMLAERGCVYNADGALWLRSSAFGDDSDRPLRRSDGRPTYVAADLAYHLDKLRRGFDRVIDLWGADHLDYIARTKAGLQAIGGEADRVEILIHQPVRLFVEGEPRLRSLRAGEIIPLDDLLDEVGTDAARFAFLSRPADESLDFDLDLARREGPENPFYRLRETRTRLDQLLLEAAARGIRFEGDADPALLGRDFERDLLSRLATFPELVAGAAAAREPWRLTAWAEELAAGVRAWDAAGAGLDGDRSLAAARAGALQACRVVLSTVFGLLGIAPGRRSPC